MRPGPGRRCLLRPTTGSRTGRPRTAAAGKCRARAWVRAGDARQRLRCGSPAGGTALTTRMRVARSWDGPGDTDASRPQGARPWRHGSESELPSVVVRMAVQRARGAGDVPTRPEAPTRPACGAGSVPVPHQTDRMFRGKHQGDAHRFGAARDRSRWCRRWTTARGGGVHGRVGRWNRPAGVGPDRGLAPGPAAEPPTRRRAPDPPAPKRPRSPAPAAEPRTRRGAPERPRNRTPAGPEAASLPR